VKRQIVCFSFYKVMPEWRRLPAAEKAAHKAAFAEVLAKWNKPGEFLSLTYSTDRHARRRGYVRVVDRLWRRRAEPDAQRVDGTPLGGYLNSPHNFLAMTKRSQYQIDRPDESEGEGRGAIRPGGQKYIFIYPFWKTRPWYLLSMSERKRLMDEHIRIGLLYPRVKLNTTYSFGIDDQEFVVAFETNFPEDFLDLVQQLRETEISMYTLKDFPIFSCVRVPADGDAGSAGGWRDEGSEASWRRRARPAKARTSVSPVGAKARAIARSRLRRRRSRARPRIRWRRSGWRRFWMAEEGVSQGGVRAESSQRVGAAGGDDSLGAVHGRAREPGDARAVQGVSDAEGDGRRFPARA
jgi:chlorite dismutase